MPRKSGLAIRVRIIGGKWKGRKLTVAASAIRPTPDRARVTLFNWLAAEMPGARVLDLFAGTGVLGFEAMSRGAAKATLVDSDREAHRQLARQREAFGADVDLHRHDAIEWLRARSAAVEWDVVFLDPPFGAGLLNAVLPLVAPRLANGGAIYVETDSPTQTLDFPPPFTVHRASVAGASHYGLLRRSEGLR